MTEQDPAVADGRLRRNTRRMGTDDRLDRRPLPRARRGAEAEAQAARPSPTGDRHLTQTVSVRLPADLRAWFAERAQATGQSPHALMLAALGDYRDAHSLRRLGDYAAMPRRAGVAPAEAAE